MRLINDDDAIYELKRAFPADDFGKIIRCISRTPTADVPERNVGKWKVYYDDDNPQDGILKCSACGYIRFFDDCSPTNFCPQCGADMSEETEDEH